MIPANHSGKFGKSFAMALGLLLLAAIGYADYLSGPGIYLLPLYLIPVFLVTWFSWEWSRGLFAALSVSIWLIEYSVFKSPKVQDPSAYWNISINLILFFLFAYIISELRNSVTRVNELTRTDSLTGLSNRSAFYEVAGTEMHRTRRYKRPFTVAYVDIDNFKMVNYRYGHGTGDSLLNLIGQTIKNNVREVDIVARFGGDEFALLMPETGAESAQIVLSRLRARLLEATKRGPWTATFSFGAVTFLTPPGSVEEMVKRAGTMMYTAKNIGPNSIEQEVFEEGPQAS